MRILLLGSKVENNKIYLNFQHIYFCEGPEDNSKQERRNNIPNIFQMFEEDFHGISTEEAKKLLIREFIANGNNIEFVYKEKKYKGSYIFTRYMLPTNKKDAFFFLSAIQKHLHFMNIDRILFFNDGLNNQIVNNKLNRSIEHYLQCESESDSYKVVQQAADKIRKLKIENNPYAEIFELLKNHMNLPANEFLSTLNSLIIVKKEEVSEWESPLNSIALLHNKKKTKEENKKEFNDLINTFNLAAKKNWYQPCIGRIAEDGLLYTWKYSEWRFIKEANFVIRSDGRMSIIDLEKNEAYQKTYAPGQKNFEIFRAEFKWLGKFISLEIEENCDMHREIIFTHQCSQELIKRGLHINDATYVRSLIKMKNSSLIFFGKGKHDNPQELNELHLRLSALPQELLLKIMQLTSEHTGKPYLVDTKKLLQSAQENADVRFNRYNK